MFILGVIFSNVKRQNLIFGYEMFWNRNIQFINKLKKKKLIMFNTTWDFWVLTNSYPNLGNASQVRALIGPSAPCAILIGRDRWSRCTIHKAMLVHLMATFVYLLLSSPYNIYIYIDIHRHTHSHNWTCYYTLCIIENQ